MTPEETHISPEAENAVHKAKNAAQALEIAREVQLAEVVEKTALRTKESLLEGLREVFGDGDAAKDPKELRVLVHRIPIICEDVKEMKRDISDTASSVAKINDNLSRVVWIILTAVILAILGLIFVK